MTKPDFLAEVPFSVFGLPGDFAFDKNTTQPILTEQKEGKKHEYHIVIEDDYFEIFYPLFGRFQFIEIPFAVCELKQ
jgi:hypothetical protein